MSGTSALFIYDSGGKLAAERIVSNSETSSPLSQYGYAVHLDPSELRPGKYRLQAVAMQKDWEDALATPGAKYRRNSPPYMTSDCSARPWRKQVSRLATF